MAGKKKPVFRLTIFFISVVFVSGSVLAYFSINNISNLKALTEKRVREEQKCLALALTDQIEEQIIALAKKFSDSEIVRNHHQIADIRLLDTIDLIGRVFAIDRNGDFLWPWFMDGLENPIESVSSFNFQSNFKQAESAEFIEKDFGKAKSNYLSSLHFSSSDFDSVQALNALARLSVKMEDHPQAFSYYSTIISKYYGLCDTHGFPYAYYAIPQLIRISDASSLNLTLKEIGSCLTGMETGSIPLNHSTHYIVLKVSNWIDSVAEHNEIPIPLKESIRTIEKHLSFIERNKEVIREFLAGDKKYDSPMISGSWQVLNRTLHNGGEILLASLDGKSAKGFSILITQLWNMLSEGDPVLDTDFEYELALLQMKDGNNGPDLPWSTLFEISSFFPGYQALIKLKHEGLIDELVRRRSWIYGIALSLLLGGMILGILLILRDISREEHLARLRADFISNVTHELKTPLTSIQLFTESMVLNRIKSAANKKEYLKIILKETESLKRMINNILDFSREAKGRREYHFEKVSISSLVHAAIADIEYWLVEMKFTLVKEIDDHITAFVDPMALRQAIINLVNNAIKFSVNRKEIAIRLKKENEHILIQVEDKGIGIPDDQMDLIFQPFYRVGQRHAEDISGTGLGLSVVKEIVDAHHGEIRVNSHLNEGSTFTIQINTILEKLA